MFCTGPETSQPEVHNKMIIQSFIRRVVLIALGSFLRQSSLAFTSVTSALEVFLNGMRYINPRFTSLLTYLQDPNKPHTCSF